MFSHDSCRYILVISKAILKTECSPLAEDEFSVVAFVLPIHAINNISLLWCKEIHLVICYADKKMMVHELMGEQGLILLFLQIMQLQCNWKEVLVCILCVEMDNICKKHLHCVLKGRGPIFLEDDFAELHVLNSLFQSDSLQKKAFSVIWQK